jgi:1-pyrroline-4-hydroxy-2-carboxylate deaminase
MDTVPKFIQLIKQIQQEAGIGSARVRPPRLEVIDDELSAARATYEHAQANRPAVAFASTQF